MSKTLPHWDMTRYFPSLGSEEFQLAFKELKESISSLKELFDAKGIRAGSGVEISEDLVTTFEGLLERINAVSEETRLISAYVYSFTSTDTRNTEAQARLSEFHLLEVQLRKLDTRFKGWIGSLDVEELISKSQVAKDHAFALRKDSRASEFLMSEVEEDLYGDLSVTGGSAWGRLHGDITSRLMVDIEHEGRSESVPMSVARGRAQDSDRSVREAAYRAELKAWETVAVPLSAAMNSIKGEDLVVFKRRGWQDPLAKALFANNVDRQTLEAMQSAVVESFGDFRRYLRAKAKLLSIDKMAFFDLFAPVGSTETKKWQWDEATEFIVSNFGAFSDRMAGLAQRSFDEGWVDAEPRDGKHDGAFCMGVKGEASGVFLNFTGSFNSVQTLAHELGHAYHNLNLAPRTHKQRQTPMALAETASIFCQTIVIDAGLEQAPESERLAILENDLQSSCQVVVDIHSRFLFERAVYEQRDNRELSVDELNELMLDAQKQTYGDGLDHSQLHPYMWAVKPHYYGATFYNWPYTFGLLFGLGLYAQGRQDPEGFRKGYDELLSSTGLDDAAAVCARFGIDVRDPEFWRASLKIIAERIDEFEKLAG